MGAVRRESRPRARRGSGAPRSARRAHRRAVSGRPTRGRRRPAREGMDAGAGHRFHRRTARERGAGSRAVHGVARPGARLSHRQPEDPCPAHEGRGGAGRRVRRTRLPRRASERRNDAPEHPRGEDGSMDRGTEAQALVTDTARDAAGPSAAEVDAALRRLGHVAFRPGQREAIDTLLAHGRLLLVAPTGGGKSLSYQLPATILGGTTLVVSPLVALMADQVQALEARGVRATYLASTLDGAEMRRRMARIARREPALVYVAPERLAFPGFRSLLGALACPLVAIDEAHCISEWGHDFRPEYLEIGGLVRELPGARLLACTATATPVVRDEILARLGLPADTPQLVRGFARPNLSLRALEIESAADARAAVDAGLAEALGGPGKGRGTAIVFAPTRRRAADEGTRLASLGWGVCVYHAGLSAAERDRAQRAFANGRVEVVVATNAFGMGIDRPDVRAVVHLGPPGSIEAYYQEVGRAGRDGSEALGLLLVSPRDLPLRRALLERGGEAPVAAAVIEHKWGLFLELIRWVEGGSCRHDAILRYFGDEAETLNGCGRCDVCRRLAGAAHSPAETALIVRKARSGVARVHGRFGLLAAVKLVHGDADPKLERAGLTGLKTFGNLRSHSERWRSEERRVGKECRSRWSPYH